MNYYIAPGRRELISRCLIGPQAAAQGKAYEEREKRGIQLEECCKKQGYKEGMTIMVQRAAADTSPQC